MSAAFTSDRTSGIPLQAPTLPGGYGCWDLGAPAHAFADFLARAGQRRWQVLPVGPAGFGYSPCSAKSAFAGSPFLINLDALEIRIEPARFAKDACDFERARIVRERHLHATYANRGASDRRKQARFVVPPDYFSKTGQRWGNPLYKWARVAKASLQWWLDRFRGALENFDAVRLNHFIGFVRFSEVPASDPTAVNGQWKKGRGRALFDAVRKTPGDLPLVPEDLGAVVPAVSALRDELGVPGMRLLQCAIGDDDQAETFLPYKYPHRTVAYTLTLDTDTIVDWFERSATAAERKWALAYVWTDNGADLHWKVTRSVSASVATTAIFPLQDVLGLGSDARMNTPATIGGSNWHGRIRGRARTKTMARRLRELTRTYGRIQ